MATSIQKRKKYIPGCNTRGEEIFDFPFIKDEKTVEYIKSHAKVMFIIRGPPGTGKSTCSSLIKEKYDEAVICSADDYFNRAFTRKNRDKESLKESHKYCKNRTEEECENETHPIIVQNTHMKKWEVQTYVDLANKYGYTIVMAITVRKFEVNPEVLEKTNQKGLNKAYFVRRLACWEEFYPQYLGLFLGPEDSMFLLNEAKDVLLSLLDDGKFCKAFNVFSDDDVLNYFEPQPLLSCITFEEGLFQRSKFYLTDEVQDCYGKCYALNFQGFIISKLHVVAVIKIPADGEHLFSKKPLTNTSDELLLNALENMSLNMSSVKGNSDATFNREFKFKVTSVNSKDWDSSTFTININDLNVIVLSNKGPKITTNVKQFLLNTFQDTVDQAGNINIEFSELDNGISYHRLNENAWFVQMKENVSVNSLFTGYYLK